MDNGSREMKTLRPNKKYAKNKKILTNNETLLLGSSVDWIQT